MKTLLWLDDLRNPFEDSWLFDYAYDFAHHAHVSDQKVIWAKSYDDFVSWIEENGLPDKIGFDHDLGQDVAIEKVKKGMSKRQARKEKAKELSGYEAAKWLVEYCMDNGTKIPDYFVQSANPVGKQNIISYLENAKKHLNA